MITEVCVFLRPFGSVRVWLFSLLSKLDSSRYWLLLFEIVSDNIRLEDSDWVLQNVTIFVYRGVTWTECLLEEVLPE